MMNPVTPVISPLMLLCLALVGIIIVLCFALLMNRQHTLASRHDSLVVRHEALAVKHEGLSSDVNAIRSSMTSIHADLGEIRKDGKNNTELLHTIIRGTIESANGK